MVGLATLRPKEDLGPGLAAINNPSFPHLLNLYLFPQVQLGYVLICVNDGWAHVQKALQPSAAGVTAAHTNS